MDTLFPDDRWGAQEPDEETLAGRVERVVFHNPDSGWGILHVLTDQGDKITAAGVLAAPAGGESLRLGGRWEDHPRYGRQFRFSRYELLRPTTPEAIIRYLSSGMIRGVGPVLATAIVRRFGADTLRVLDEEPRRLTEVSGIGAMRAEMVQAAWEEHERHRGVLLFCYQHGLGVALSQKILERYGERAIEVVEREPYRLALDISGISFHIADRIARSLGVAPDDPQRLQAGLMHVLGQALGEGHMYLPLEELVRQAEALTNQGEEALYHALDLLQEAGRVYVDASDPGEPAAYDTRMYHVECEVAERLRALETGEARMPAPADLEAWLASQEQFVGLELTAEQREAAAEALRHGLAIITGGPGTGKTTLVSFLVHLARQRGENLALAAPTGRAAKRLEEVTGHPAQTLHRLLSFDPFRGGFRHGPGNPLTVDWLIVDEASMLEVPLAAHVLRALPRGARLLLVGDADQLPSVGPGQLLADMIRSGAVPVLRLTEIHRQAQGSLIVQSAHRINSGEGPLLVTPQAWREEPGDLVFLERNEPAQAAEKVVELATEGLPRMGFRAEEIQIITSLHRGPIGVRELNRQLQAAVNPPGGKAEIARGETVFRLGDRVLQTVNDYDKLVYNGDIGRITALDAQEGLLTVTYEQGAVAYTRADLEQLELAYALTVHKSQGSEFPAVVLVVHSSHYIMLHRNLLYTGFTRARRMLCLVGDKRGLYKAINTTHHAERYTRLAQRLRE